MPRKIVADKQLASISVTDVLWWYTSHFITLLKRNIVGKNGLKCSYKVTILTHALCDHLCDLVVRVPGCRYRDPEFDSRHHQMFCEVVGLERGPLSLVSAIEELLWRNSSGSSLENREYGYGDLLRWPCGTLYLQKLELTSPIFGGHLVSIVRLRTKATGLKCYVSIEFGHLTVSLGHVEENILT
jgi:hypothetical protein